MKSDLELINYLIKIFMLLDDGCIWNFRDQS